MSVQHTQQSPVAQGVEVVQARTGPGGGRCR